MAPTVWDRGTTGEGEASSSSSSSSSVEEREEEEQDDGDADDFDGRALLLSLFAWREGEEEARSSSSSSSSSAEEEGEEEEDDGEDEENESRSLLLSSSALREDEEEGFGIGAAEAGVEGVGEREDVFDFGSSIVGACLLAIVMASHSRCTIAWAAALDLGTCVSSLPSPLSELNGAETFDLSARCICCKLGMTEPPRHLRSRFFRSTSVFSVSASAPVSAASAVGVVGVVGMRTGDRLAVGIDLAWAEEQESQGDCGSSMSRGLRIILGFRR